MLELKNVTLAAVSSKARAAGNIRALKYSMRNVKFAETVLISDKKPLFLPESIQFKKMDTFSSIDDFNHFMVYDLYKYIETEFAMIVHDDGFIVHPECWKTEFLDYDYIGAPWPLPDAEDLVSYRDHNGQICRVGNSVSIRSKRLMELPDLIDLPWKKFGGWYNEDGFICVNNKHIFEEHGMTIAPIEIAKYFSHESMIPEIQGITPFAFHKWQGTNAKYPNRIYCSYIRKKGYIIKKILGEKKHGI